MAKLKKSILYVNFSPYINAGNILDFLLSHFETVTVFCFHFYDLGKDQDPSMITIYKNKKIVYQFPLFQTPTPAPLVFVLLPLRSVVICIQLFFHSLRLIRINGTFDYFFTVNAFIAWCGNILRTLKIVRHTIFWVWDYYPPYHPDFMVRLMRNMYWQFDKPATLTSDTVVFLNRRLAELRKTIGILPHEFVTRSIGIATNPNPKSLTKIRTDVHLVFFGVVKKSHGIDLIFQSSNELHKRFPHITIHIIGGGPEEENYKKIAMTSPVTIKFHGFIRDESQIDALIKKCDIGIAPYIDDESSVSQYTDPSKIKRYISNGIPVIATDVFEFSETINTKHAGVIISYNSSEFVAAIDRIIKSYMTYQKGAISLAKDYSYHSLYYGLFPNILTKKIDSLDTNQ